MSVQNWKLCCAGAFVIFGEGGGGGPQSEVLSFAPDPVAEHAAHLPQLIMEKV